MKLKKRNHDLNIELFYGLYYHLKKHISNIYELLENVLKIEFTMLEDNTLKDMKG